LKVKKLNVLIWIFSVILFAGWSTGYAQSKIRYLNSQEILDQLPEAQEIQKKLDDIRVGYENEYNDLIDRFEKLTKEIESQSLLLSPEKKAEKEREKLNLQQQIENFQREKLGPQGEFYRKNTELTRPLYDKIDAVIQKISDEEGYDMVFDVVGGVMVFAKDEYDITQKVLDELNKGS
jgi:outer membrane protein